MAALIEVRVPDLGEFADVPVIELLVAPGDAVAAEDPLLVLESEKATMEIPAPTAGTVDRLLVKVDDTVSEGDLLLTLLAEEAAEPAPADAADAPDAGRLDGERVYAGPGARRQARELGVDLAAVRGTGPKGRITRDDVGAVAGATAPSPAPPDEARPRSTQGNGLPPWPSVDFAAFGPVETVELSRVRRIAGPNLARNWLAIPHVTQHDEADITDLEAFRREVNAAHGDGGVKVTMVSLLLKACAASLRAFPEFNSSLDGGALVLKRYYHLGFAVDTPQGLMVPVIRDVDRKGLLEIARELAQLSGAARDGKLSSESMRGGTFTISSLGGIGGTAFTPIVNAPEVAILGASRAAMKPVWSDGEFRPRLVLPLSLSYDHRVVDGAAAARFTTHLARLLADPRRMLL
jgi:pyruvate dehydrogenase E2 component (dihydrolipoamide acetyltransferase)